MSSTKPQRSDLHLMGGLHDRLRNHPEHGAWISYLEALDAPEFDVRFPGPGSLASLLNDLAIPHEDIDLLIAMVPDRKRDPDVWWLIERAAASLAAYMGEIDNPESFPFLAEGDDVFLRYYGVYVFIALHLTIMLWHRERGIPEDVSRHTLMDLGRHLAVGRRRFGVGGLWHAGWLTLHFQGALYQLGRLQFQRARLGNTTGKAVAAARHPFGPRDGTLSVHINAFAGPFSPAACNDAFASAQTFFPRHFPEESYRTVVCHSWLLDPQLADYLPDTSNIIQFQRRFTLVERELHPYDDGAFEFVFGKTTDAASSLPRDSTLQRAMLDHVRDGGHWYGRSGWMILP